MIENLPLKIGIAIVTVLAMEPLVALIHKHVMHGWGWGWHRDHHEPGHGKLEKNDLYAVVGAAIATAVFALAGHFDHWLWWVGLGMTVYGLLYALVHDGLVHRRWPFRFYAPKSGYLKRLVEAHHLHHAVRGRQGAVSFGFLYAPPPEKLREELKRKRRAGEGDPARA